MIKKWHSSTHPISDIRDWNKANALVVQPDYQRREVWGEAARVMLMDSIMNGIPMPKIFVSSHIKDGRTIRTVIDGQQRISAILSFLSGAYELKAPYDGAYLGKKFDDLPEDVRDNVILAYEIDFNEAKGLSDAELREVYSRVNKYLVALNRQELRKADFPGHFLNVSEELANIEFFDEAGLYTAASRRRSLDVEFTSELLCALVLGMSERKDAIDQCYQNLKIWEKEDQDLKVSEFKGIIEDLSKIFSSEYTPIKKTRWKQKADFYSLFVAIGNLKREGLVLPDDLIALREDLSFLDKLIAPTSEISIFSQYAVYCVSQANSAASRRWRTNFLEGILRGTYAGTIDDKSQREVIFKVATDIRYAQDPTWNSDGCQPFQVIQCPVCGKDEQDLMLEDAALIWSKTEKSIQFSNVRWAHAACCENTENIVLLPSEFDYLDDSDDE